MEDDGWCLARTEGGATGLVPYNFLRMITLDDWDSEDEKNAVPAKEQRSVEPPSKNKEAWKQMTLPAPVAPLPAALLRRYSSLTSQGTHREGRSRSMSVGGEGSINPEKCTPWNAGDVSSRMGGEGSEVTNSPICDDDVSVSLERAGMGGIGTPQSERRRRNQDRAGTRERGTPLSKGRRSDDVMMGSEADRTPRDRKMIDDEEGSDVEEEGASSGERRDSVEAEMGSERRSTIGSELGESFDSEDDDVGTTGRNSVQRCGTDGCSNRETYATNSSGSDEEEQDQRGTLDTPQEGHASFRYQMADLSRDSNRASVEGADIFSEGGHERPRQSGAGGTDSGAGDAERVPEQVVADGMANKLVLNREFVSHALRVC